MKKETPDSSEDPASWLAESRLADQAAFHLSAYSPRSLMNQGCCSGHHHSLVDGVARQGGVVELLHLLAAAARCRPWRSGWRRRRWPSGRAFRRSTSHLANSCACSTFLALAVRHEALVPGEGAFLRRDVAEAVVAQVEAGRIPVQAEEGAVGLEGGLGLVLARPELHDVRLDLDASASAMSHSSFIVASSL